MPTEEKNRACTAKNAFSKASSERRCLECGALFMPKRPHRIFCSDAHRLAHWKREKLLRTMDASQPGKVRTMVVLGTDESGEQFGFICWRKP